MKMLSLILSALLTIGHITQAEEPMVNYMVTKNDGGNLTFQLCQVQKTEVGTNVPWKCRDLSSLSKLTVDDFLNRLEHEDNACHMRITAKDAKEFAAASALLVIPAFVIVGWPVWATSGKGSLAWLAALGVSVVGGYIVMRADSDTCANIWKLLVRRVYETALKKVPDGYQRSDLLSDEQFAIISGFLK